MLRIRLFSLCSTDIYVTVCGGRTLQELYSNRSLHVNQIIRRGLLLISGGLLWAGRKSVAGPARVGPVLGLLSGFTLGMNIQRRYRRIRRLRERLRQVLAQELEEEQLEFLMHQVPYWISIQEYERVVWVNRIVKLLWPCYTSAICRLLLQELQTLLSKHKPSFISSISVEQLTLGEMPFDIQKVRLVSNRTQDLVLEAAIRWNASDSQLALMIKPLKGVELVPKLRRIHMYATVNVVLRPLLPRFPCFGAVAVALKQPPLVNFELDFGMIDVGKVVPIAPRSLAMAQHVEAWLKPFLVSDILGNLMVWPNRLVIPIMPENITGPLDDLRLLTRGILRVTVIEARGLRSDQAGWWGEPYPVSTLYISPLDKKSTRGQSNTLNPVWNQQLFFKVQELSLPLLVEVKDGDDEAAARVSTPNAASSPAADDEDVDVLLGRAVVLLSDLKAGAETDAWYSLGKNDFRSDGGPGMGAGQIRLKLCYWPLEFLKSQFAAPSCSLPRTHTFGLHPDGAASAGASPRREALGTRFANPLVPSLGSSRVSGRSLEPESNSSGIPQSSRQNEEQRRQRHHALAQQGAGGRGAGAEERYNGSAIMLERHDSRWAHAALQPAPVTPPPSPMVTAWGHIQESSPGRPSWSPEAPEDQLAAVETRPQRGILFLVLVSATDVPKMDVVSYCDPLVRIHVCGMKRESSCKAHTHSPVWNERFDFFDIDSTGTITVKLYDATYMGKWKVGSFSVPLAQVARAPDGKLYDSFRILGPYAAPTTVVTLSLEWIPLDANPVPGLLPPARGLNSCQSSLNGHCHGGIEVVPSDVSIISCGSSSTRMQTSNEFSSSAEPLTGESCPDVVGRRGRHGWLSISDWVQAPSQLAPNSARIQRATRFAVRVVCTTTLPSKWNSFCELKLSRHKPFSTSVFRGSDRPFWNEQFSWQDVRDNDSFALTLISEGQMWREKRGTVRIPLSEVRAAPGGTLIGSWRLGECREDTEVAMELIWWEAQNDMVVCATPSCRAPHDG